MSTNLEISRLNNLLTLSEIPPLRKEDKLSQIVKLTAVGVCLVMLIGCGSSSTIPTLPVTGIVTLDGKPLPKAIVTFYDVTGKNNASGGTTDDAGKFKLGFATFTGAMPGSYKVTIQHLTKPDGSPLTVEPGMDATQLEMQGLARQALPPSYSDYAQTILKAEVTPESSSNGVDFDLKANGT